jgi:predicted RNA-binding protein (virulence factor B family)
MNKNIELGITNKLRIDRFAEPGAYLMAEDEEDVLLPNCYVTDDMYVDDEIDVFIYTDSEDRLVSTTLKPKAKVGEYGYFKIVAVQKFGAFADWGLMKDLFIPISCQKRPFKVGDKRILRVAKEERREMIIGDEKIGRYLSNKPTDVNYRDSVKCLVIAKTPMGFKVVVNNKYEGMIFTSEIYEDLRIGDKKEGFIKKIRDDGKLDIALRVVGRSKDVATVDLIKEMLKDKGKLPYTYKIDPEVAKSVFKTSRKGFKRALTELIEKKEIELLDDGIIKKK